MFHFKRRTLWIIIYVTIPLIFILNQFGPKPEDQAKPSEIVTQWSLDSINERCDAVQPWCFLPLPSSGEVVVSAVLDRIPIGAVEIPKSVAVRTYQQGGRFIATLRSTNSHRNQKAVSAFLEKWLPNEADIFWTLSGDINPNDVEDWLVLKGGEGEFTDITSQPQTALTTFNAPSLGDAGQLAHLLWIEILKQRLAGYSVQVTWDHRSERSLVLINQTVVNEADAPVTQEELNPIVSAYLSSAQRRVRTQEQLHRYLTTGTVYDVPFQYFVEQPQRLQAITVADVNRMRENTLAQISQTNN